MTQAYPLHWPQGFPRTKSRASSKFSTSITGAINNVNDELRRFGNDTGKAVTNMVISSNCSLGNMRPADPGIAVYFSWDGIDCCIAVDRYNKAEDNLQAIAKVLDAERAKMRHGGLNIARASFRGFAALPPPKGPDGQIAPPWWSTLGFGSETQATAPEIERRWKEAAKQHHPDKGGDAAKFNMIVEAVRLGREAMKVTA